MKNQENVPVKILRKYDSNSTFLRFLNHLNIGVNFGFTNDGDMFVQKDDELARVDAGILQKVVPLTASNITGMYGTAVPLIPAPGAGKVIHLLDALLVYKFGTAGFGGGGDVTLRSGSTIITATVTAGNSFGAAADRIVPFTRLDTAGGVLLTENAAINIANATGAFTLGTATGYGYVVLFYRIIDTTKPVTYSL